MLTKQASNLLHYDNQFVEILVIDRKYMSQDTSTL